MPTDNEREEIIRQLLKLLDEITSDTFHDDWTHLVRAKLEIAKHLVRKLAAPKKPDGDTT